MTDPTVYIRIGTSAIAHDAKGEIIETVDFNEDGTPDWIHGGICDARGERGDEAVLQLAAALGAAEANAKLVGYHVEFIEEESEDASDFYQFMYDQLRSMLNFALDSGWSDNLTKKERAKLQQISEYLYDYEV
jgi:hypothetical protein